MKYIRAIRGDERLRADDVLKSSRMHVHVVSGDGEAKFWLEPALQLAQSYRYSPQQLSEIESLIEAGFGVRVTTQLVALAELADNGKSGNSEGHYHELISAWQTTSAVEVTNISSHGIWLLTHGRELFLPYDEFHWFMEQPVKAILNVEEPSPGHYYWPEIDVDLTEEMIEHPERFPNKAKNIET